MTTNTRPQPSARCAYCGHSFEDHTRPEPQASLGGGRTYRCARGCVCANFVTTGGQLYVDEDGGRER